MKKLGVVLVIILGVVITSCDIENISNTSSETKAPTTAIIEEPVTEAAETVAEKTIPETTETVIEETIAIEEIEIKASTKWLNLLSCTTLASYSSMMQEYISLGGVSTFGYREYVIPGEYIVFRVDVNRKGTLYDLETRTVLPFLENVDLGPCEGTIYKTTNEGSICVLPASSSIQISPQLKHGEEFYVQFVSLGQGGMECWVYDILMSPMIDPNENVFVIGDPAVCAIAFAYVETEVLDSEG
ncbi:MAG: hypothetical protein ACYC00_20015 [Eubacteriales bacterium]